MYKAIVRMMFSQSGSPLRRRGVAPQGAREVTQPRHAPEPKNRYRIANAQRGGWCLAALLLCSVPVAAQIKPEEAAGQARMLPKRPRWLTGIAAGPSVPVGPSETTVGSGFDAASTVEYAFYQPANLWVRATLDVNQFTTTEKLAGPGYAYQLKINQTATSLLLDVGYRQNFGRVAPFLFVGVGGAYLSSSQLTGQQSGQPQRAGSESRYTVSTRAGVGLEYRLFKSGAIPYTELTFLTLPDQRVAGKRLALMTPLLGVKFPF